MAGRVDGKVAIVSGAGSSGPGIGTGKAISVLLAAEGARVLLVDKFEERARETAESIEAAGGDGSVLAADVTDPVTCERVVDEAVARFGSVDVLVNNAAISPMVSVLDTDAALFDRVMALNVRAPFLLSRAAIRVMIERGGGSIVNLTSILSLRGTGFSQAAYATSKAALLGFTVDAANAYGRQGVRVNSVAPGHIDTPMRSGVAREAGADPAKLDASDKTALGREGDAWDVARAVLYLASDDARFVTGVHLPVDGGTLTKAP